MKFNKKDWKVTERESDILIECLNPTIAITEEEYTTKSGETYSEGKKEEDVTLWPSLNWFKKNFKNGKKINTKSGITPVDDGCNKIEVLVEKLGSRYVRTN